MPVRITANSITGRVLFATLERLSDSARWNNTASAWQASPSLADRKITLTEGSAENLQSYTASVSGLGDSGITRLRIHDDADANDKCIIGPADFYVRGGEELPTLVNAIQWAGTEVDANDIAVKETLAKGTHLTGFNDLSAAQVNAEADQALADYDSPTNAEMVARTLVSADYGTAANQTTLLNRLGAFTGSGLNTVLGFFRALLRKDASLTPSDVGGTFDNTTDSTEAIRDALPAAAPTAADIWGYANRQLTAFSFNVNVAVVNAGAITASSFAAGAIDAAAIATDALGSLELAAGAATEIADAVLSRSVTFVEATAAEHSLCTIILGATESSRSGATWAIRKTDGTSFVNKTLTLEAGATPATGVT